MAVPLYSRAAQQGVECERRGRMAYIATSAAKISERIQSVRHRSLVVFSGSGARRRASQGENSEEKREYLFRPVFLRSLRADRKLITSP